MEIVKRGRDINVSEKGLRESVNIFKAIDHNLRLKMLRMISNNGSMFVGAIYKELLLDQSIVSQHLKILRDADLVHFTSIGRNKYYVVNYIQLDRVKQVIDFLIK